MGKPAQKYDELQYCEESDVEPVTSRKASPEAKQKEFLRFMRKRGSNLSHNSASLHEIDSSDSLDGLSNSDLSVYSSPRQRREREDMAEDRVLPFDFQTNRKAKRFFKEPYRPINELLQDQTLSRKEVKQELRRVLFDDDEDAKLKEVPEINDTLRKMYKVKHKPLTAQKLLRLTRARQASIKNLDSLSDDGTGYERHDGHHYAERVQNTQIQDPYSQSRQVLFQRTQAKNLKTKRAILQKIALFKQNIPSTQIEALKQRQFVIVDIQQFRRKPRKEPVKVEPADYESVLKAKTKILKANFSEEPLAKPEIKAPETLRTEGSTTVSKSMTNTTRTLIDPRSRQDLKTVIASSPYTQITAPEQKPRVKGIKGIMLDKLKRKSILNCDLFRQVVPDSSNPSGLPKSRSLLMTERISSVLGIRLPHQLQQTTSDFSEIR